MTLDQRIQIGTDVHQAEWLNQTCAGQTLLAAAYTSHTLPRCMCQSAGVEMYVTRRNGRYYLARMPDTGFLHAPGCPSGELAGLYSGSTCYVPGVITEDVSGSLAVVADLSPAPAAPVPLEALQIDGLLDLLLEQANANRHAAGQVLPNWSQLRQRLLTAAQEIAFKGTNKPLAESLFIPAPYDRHQPTANDHAMQAFMEGPGLRLVLMPLKELSVHEYSWLLMGKHLPGTRFWLPKALQGQLGERYGRDLCATPPSYALCLASVKPGRRPGNLGVANIAIRPTDRAYLPCAHDCEMSIADQLREKGASFMRPLRFDAGPDLMLADYAIMSSLDLAPVLVLYDSPHPEADQRKRAFSTILARNLPSAVIHDLRQP